jgi:hypothetical protein
MAVTRPSGVVVCVCVCVYTHTHTNTHTHTISTWGVIEREFVARQTRLGFVLDFWCRVYLGGGSSWPGK